MQCPSCGASVSGAFCEYCGAKMPAERVETQVIHAQNVTVNNYYQQAGTRTSNPGQSTQRVDLNVGFSPVVSPKSRTIALLLCVFLGYFGAHRFYAGRILMGIVYLLTLGLFGVGWLVDIVLVALGRMRDGNGLMVSSW